jgi:hypothetical protein
MAIAIKSAGDAAAKWSQRAASAGAEYQAGAMAAGNAWQNGAVAAASNYKAAVTAGNIDARFAGGVRKAGSAKYTRKIQDVGAARYSTGVAAAQSDYEQGVAPYLQVISGLNLPARQPRGSAANLQRVATVANALAAKRLQMQGASS